MKEKKIKEFLGRKGITTMMIYLVIGVLLLLVFLMIMVFPTMESIFGLEISLT